VLKIDSNAILAPLLGSLSLPKIHYSDMSQPTHIPVLLRDISGILVHGVQGFQPADHAVHHLRLGRYVYDSATGVKIVYCHTGAGDSTALYTATYAENYNPQTRSPVYGSSSQTGRVSGAFKAQNQQTGDTAYGISGESLRCQRIQVHAAGGFTA
jgi:hypothetical protein